MSRFFRIPELTAEVLRQLFSYSPGTGIFTRKVSTNNRTKIGEIAGCRRPDGYLCTRLGGKSYQMHRLAWLYVHGAWPDGQIDHINGDRTDNRISNLRDVSHVENGRNQKLGATNKSGANGVHWFSSRKKWRAAITVNGKSRHLGYFDTVAEASEARRSADEVYGFHQNHGRSVPPAEIQL